MVKINQVSKSYSGKEILNKVTLEINDNNKIAIIGNNGTGKSTLLKILAGKEMPDEGTIENPEGKRVVYLPQEIHIKKSDISIEEYIKEELGILQIEKRMKELEDDLTQEDKINEFCELQQQYIDLNGYDMDYQLEEILNGLGISKEYKQKTIKQLSGGQKSKVSLAIALLKNPDLLLLDEPTNNLDLKAIKWLEKYIKSLNIPVIIVSHDRKFLDNTTNKTVELDYFTKELKEYPGTYSQYQKFKQKEEERQQKEYEEQVETIKGLKSSLREKKQWAQKGSKQGVKDNDKYTRGYERDRSSSLASKAKDIEKKIEQMDKVERPKKKEKLRFTIDYNKIKGSSQISTKDMVCGYNEGFKTMPISFECDFGKRIVIIGENGSGKSTFIKTLIGKQEPLEGERKLGTGLKIGYIEQNTQKEDNITIEEYMLKHCQESDKTKIFTTLNKFNFDYSEKNKRYQELSPGERTRLILATFSINEINTLILDEPTNHLDIEALEAIEEVLQEFKGTVIAVTHDRYFIEKIKPNEILELKNNKFREIEVKGITQKYQQKKKTEHEER